ncbi:2,3-diaminopropionate biosynthesis protein SbnB [Kitasatospora mediocidica]|uniref:2,3-diaminopropionate biosynthesis protein SbnB n=1 Tax=Kitasatospora mediocidica TaxID=58352 RepID=UPI00055F8C8D|nr:2,3-diaminopropionate biosynthesis protein SbnB [Kitasatospora mediocidica]
MFEFDVVGGVAVRRIVAESRKEISAIVRQAYLTHHQGDSVNPNSYFLRFPERPNSRIIALPAFLGGDCQVAGLKWIGSFPDNIANNVPRASAVLLLNDYATGYPFACLEASQISAARTAASAVLGAKELLGGRRAERIAVIGAGIIARNIVEFFTADGWTVGTFAVHDRAPEYGAALVRHINATGGQAESVDSLTEAVAGADVVVFATTAGEPYVTEPGSFAAGQVVLNVSLRDIGPEIIAESYNVLDDVEHCLTAGTSPHLAVQRYGHQDFIDGTLAQLIRGEITLGDDKPKIFSPFGLGVLDLAVGAHIHSQALEQGTAHRVPDFFGETERWN